MIHSPKVVFLDEPMTGIDQPAQDASVWQGDAFEPGHLGIGQQILFMLRRPEEIDPQPHRRGGRER